MGWLAIEVRIQKPCHQDYAEQNELEYNFYRFSCGRDRRLDAVWGGQARASAQWLQP